MSACLHLQADEAGDEQEEEDETAALFRLAAEQLKEKREEDAMSVEERILKCVSLMTPLHVVTQQQDFPVLTWRAGLHAVSSLAWQTLRSPQA